MALIRLSCYLTGLFWCIEEPCRAQEGLALGPAGLTKHGMGAGPDAMRRELNKLGMLLKETHSQVPHALPCAPRAVTSKSSSMSTQAIDFPGSKPPLQDPPIATAGLLHPTKRISCVALAVMLLSVIVGCEAGPRKTSAEQQTDKAISDRVISALNADKVLFARHISVWADGGVVHLAGYVWDVSDLYHAKRIAGSVPGVTRVVDEMELEREGSHR
jgi:BON domain